MPRAGLSTDGVVDVALAIVDEQGPEALSLSVVAARAGVAAPSLYKHVASVAELRSRVAAAVRAASWPAPCCLSGSRRLG